MGEAEEYLVQEIWGQRFLAEQQLTGEGTSERVGRSEAGPVGGLGDLSSLR